MALQVKGATLYVSPNMGAKVRMLKGTKPAFVGTLITSPNFNDTTLTVVGAALGDPVVVAPKVSVPAGGLIWAWVSAANTVTIRFYGINAAAGVTFATQDFDVYVLKNVS